MNRPHAGRAQDPGRGHRQHLPRRRRLRRRDRPPARPARPARTRRGRGHRGARRAPRLPAPGRLRHRRPGGRHRTRRSPRHAVPDRTRRSGGRPSPAAPALDGHRMTPDAVLALLGTLCAGTGGSRPRRVLVVGCEPASVDEGIGLSEPVAAAVPEAVGLIEELLRRRRSRPWPRPRPLRPRHEERQDEEDRHRRGGRSPPWSPSSSRSLPDIRRYLRIRGCERRAAPPVCRAVAPNGVPAGRSTACRAARPGRPRL